MASYETHRNSLLLWLLISSLLVAASGLAGCLGGDETVEPAESSGEGDDPAAGSATDEQRLTEVTPIVDLEDDPATAWEADVLCLAGGGPILPRVEGNYVLPGTESLSVHVEVPPTHTAVQVGYVLDSNEARGAPQNNRSITWLPQVDPGDSQDFTVEVAPGEHETGGETRWAFYERHQPPGVSEVCYTGGGVGPQPILIDAVPS